MVLRRGLPFFPTMWGFLGFCSGLFCPLVFPLVAYFALVFRFVALVLLVNYRADCAQCLRAWESTPHKQSSPLNYPLSPTIQTYPLILVLTTDALLQSTTPRTDIPSAARDVLRRLALSPAPLTHEAFHNALYPPN